MSFAPALRQAAPGKRAAVVLALSVHLLLAAFLFYGIRWQSRPPAAVEVELVRAIPQQVVPAPPRVDPVPEAKPEPKLEPKPAPKIEAKVEPKAEIKPPPKPEIAIKEKPKPKPKPVKPPVEKPLPRPKYDPSKLLDEELKKTTELKNIANSSAAAAQELAQMRSAQANAAKDRATADYIGKIRSKIKGNIVLPFDIKGNPEALFDVVQLPSGEIISVKLKKPSGHAAYDAAVERAILKSSPLPKPEQGDLFSRSLELKFRPLDD